MAAESREEFLTNADNPRFGPPSSKRRAFVLLITSSSTVCAKSGNDRKIVNIDMIFSIVIYWYYITKILKKVDEVKINNKKSNSDEETCNGL